MMKNQHFHYSDTRPAQTLRTPLECIKIHLYCFYKINNRQFVPNQREHFSKIMNSRPAKKANFANANCILESVPLSESLDKIYDFVSTEN